MLDMDRYGHRVVGIFEPASLPRNGGDLPGRWRAVSATVAGDPVPLSVAMRWSSGAVRSEVCLDEQRGMMVGEYDAQGELVYEGLGCYVLDGEELTCHLLWEDGSSTLGTFPTRYEVDRNTLTLELTGEDVAIHWSRIPW